MGYLFSKSILNFTHFCYLGNALLWVGPEWHALILHTSILSGLLLFVSQKHDRSPFVSLLVYDPNLNRDHSL